MVSEATNAIDVVPVREAGDQVERCLINHAQMARLLHLAPSEIMRKEKCGQFDHAFAYRHNGRNYYIAELLSPKSREEIQAIVNKKSMLAGPRTLVSQPSVSLRSRDNAGPKVMYTGEDASMLFAAFEDGASMIDVVVQKKVHPDIARDAYEKWRQMRGYVLLQTPHLEAITKLGLEGSYPIETPEQLLGNLKEIKYAQEPCSRCKGKHQKPRAFCAVCVEEVREAATMASLPKMPKGRALKKSSQSEDEELDDVG